MRGRKPSTAAPAKKTIAMKIKKESPNEGTETPHDLYRIVRDPFIKKESPNEGAEKTMME